MNSLPSCSGDSVLHCIFAKIDDDRNGLITLPEFMLFAVRDLKLYSLDGDLIREKFYQIDTDGSGGLDYSEFCEFLEIHVVGCDPDEGQRRKGPRGKTVVLGLERALHIYAKQQIKAHQAKGRNKDPNVCPTQLPPDGGSLLEHHNLTVEILADSINKDAKEILDYWFPERMEDAMTLWFGKSPKLDDYIRDKFGELVDLAREGELDSWTSDPIECLALVILLDQFPRNIYRHQRDMYATDEKAQAVCTKALYNNYHRYITPLQAIFMPCLVYTHSELFQHQELCVDIWCHFIQNTLPQDDPLRIFEMIFLKHLKVVAKFGRFPHRNEILNRDCTYEEEQFLNDKSFRFDLPLHYSKDGKVSFKETSDFKANKHGIPLEEEEYEEDDDEEDEDEEDDEDDGHQAAMGMIQTLQFWKKTLEDQFPDVDIVIQKKTGGMPAYPSNTSSSSRDSGLGLRGSSSPSPSSPSGFGRRSSRAALEMENDAGGRRGTMSAASAVGRSNNNNNNNSSANLLSVNQRRTLLEADDGGRRGGGGGGSGKKKEEEEKRRNQEERGGVGGRGAPPVNVARDKKMTAAELEKRFEGNFEPQPRVTRRSSLANSLAHKDEPPKRSKSKNREKLQASTTNFDRRF